MAVVNVEARVEKEVNGLKNKILQAFKKTGGIKGEIEYSYDDETGIHTITLENNLGGFSMTMADIVNASTYAVVATQGEKPGLYDWKSGMYIKDYAWVEFTV